MKKTLELSPLLDLEQPGYPSRTQLPDYRALLSEPETPRQRFGWAAVLGASGLALGACQTPGERKGTTSQIVAQTMRRLAHRDPGGEPVTIHPVAPLHQPRLRLLLGGGGQGVLDAAMVRDATVQLFNSYGILVETRTLTTDDEVRLEGQGFHHHWNVGFEIVVLKPVAAEADLAPATSRDEALKSYFESVVRYLDWVESHQGPPPGTSRSGILADKSLTDISNPKVREIVDRYLGEQPGELDREGNGHWEAGTLLVEVASRFPGNPRLIVPDIQISFGNSYVGVLDVAAARKATVELFQTYGYALRQGERITVSDQNVEFIADGWDPSARVGFQLVFPRFGPSQLPSSVLDLKELGRFSRWAAEDQQDWLMADPTLYPNMDGDLHTPLKYYLKSVVRYLEWLHTRKK